MMGEVIHISRQEIHGKLLYVPLDFDGHLTLSIQNSVKRK